MKNTTLCNNFFVINLVNSFENFRFFLDMKNISFKPCIKTRTEVQTYINVRILNVIIYRYQHLYGELLPISLLFVNQSNGYESCTLNLWSLFLQTLKNI